MRTIKRITILIGFAFLLTACPQVHDDDFSTDFDITLLFGQWNEVNLCDTQNNLVFTEVIIRINGTNLEMKIAKPTYFRLANLLVIFLQGIVK